MPDLSDYPRFTLKERDRRWGRLRELMRQRDCVCIVAPAAPGPDEQAPSRYLSQIGGEGASAWVIFPLEGEVTAVLGSQTAADFFSSVSDWVPDLRVGPAVKEVAARLSELGLAGERIGLANFQGAYKNADGAIPYETVRRLQDALPKVTLYGENEALDMARLVKGEEEIAFIEQATAANEAAIQAMCETARPGVRQEEVWAAMACATLRATGAYPQRLSIGVDADGGSAVNMPNPQPIPQGALLCQEVTARYQGYFAQSNHTIQVGSGGPAIYKSSMKATVSIFQALIDWIKPGQTMAELVERWEQEFARHDAEPDQRVLLHTCGLGNEFPRLMTGSISQQEAEVVIQPGMVFTLKPWLRYLSGRSAWGTFTQFGDPVLVTENGTRRLGRRPMEPIVVG